MGEGGSIKSANRSCYIRNKQNVFTNQTKCVEWLFFEGLRTKSSPKISVCGVKFKK